MFEKMPEEQLKELSKLAVKRVGEAAMTVLQLIDHPGQASAAAGAMAAHLVQLSGLFAHTASTLEGESKSHPQIVGEILAWVADAITERPPTEKQLETIAMLKRLSGAARRDHLG